MNYKFRSTCLSCKKKKLKKIIDLGNHSFADRFIPKKKLNLKDPKYPLILDLCTHCKFIQSRTITNPKNRYINNKYPPKHYPIYFIKFYLCKKSLDRIS